MGISIGFGIAFAGFVIGLGIEMGLKAVAKAIKEAANAQIERLARSDNTLRGVVGRLNDGGVK